MDEKTEVVYKKWDAPSAQLVLLLVHGLGAHTGRWEFFSQFFLEHGISSYAIELKGFGHSKGIKGHIDSLRIYFDDIRALRSVIKRENLRARCFLVGESLGGLIAFLLAIREPRLFDGLICMSPAFKSRLKFSFFDYIGILTSFFFNPRKQFIAPFNARMCTQDSEYQKVMEQDEREHRFVSSGLLVRTAVSQLKAASFKHKLAVPVLFLVAGQDFLVDPRASINIFNGLKTKDKTIIHYPEMYHALYIDTQRKKVFADILQWLEQRKG